MKTIFCFGDSNTWGYIPGSGERYSFRTRWTGALQEALGYEFRIIEEGLNGRTTVWNEPFRSGRNGSLFLGPLLESHAPIDLLIVSLGTNDLKHFYGATAFDSARGMQSLISIARTSCCGPGGTPPRILIVAPPPMTQLSADMLTQFQGAKEKSQQFAKAFYDLAKLEQCNFFDAGQVVSCSSIDGVHLDESGHQQLAKALQHRVRGILDD